MIPRSTRAKLFVAICLFVSLGLFLAKLNGPVSQAQGPPVTVSAADPASTSQGTINLNVKVNGKGFKNGAKAKWTVTGTNDPGGVTVNSTTFVSSTEVTANITVADTANIANFDIQVTNSDGRGGKGTELFTVIGKSARNTQCPALQPAPVSDTKCYAAQPGCLDSSFGGVGFVHLSPGPSAYPVSANGVAVQPDGKIVVIGTAKISYSIPDFAVIRYNADGSLDTSFGDVDPLNPASHRGYAVTALTTSGDTPDGLALQPDGKIVVSGSAQGGSVVVRYKSDGTLDNTFGSSGIVHIGTGSPDITLQADGKIVVSGSSATTGFNLTRLKVDGSLDTSFGSKGQVTVNPSSSKNGGSAGVSVAIQRVPAVTGEERIILAGRSNLSSNTHDDWTLMRFRSNGATDTTFGNAGIVKTAFSGFDNRAEKVRIDSSNRILVAGITRGADISCGSYVNDVAVVRYTQDGAIDGTFSGGKQVVDFYGGGDSPSGLALQTDGKILVFGVAQSSDGTVVHFGLIRFNTDGSRDFAFGLMGNGIVTTDLYGNDSWAFGGVAVQPGDGKIVVAGATDVTPNSKGEIAVVRYWP